jgi:CRP/FNR family transcriptional regulator, dissimilatory nitrate respiration regulator
MSPRSAAAASLDRRLMEGLVPRLRVFWGVTPGNLAPLTRQCWVLNAPRGTAIMHRGARLPGIFALAYGSVKISLRADDGEERVLQLVTPGQTFGEAEALLGRASLTDGVTLGESKLVVIPNTALMSLMDRDARFARSLVMVLAERTLELQGEIASGMRRSAQRLASYLGSLDGNGSNTVHLPVSKTLVAARLGVKKETLSRLLRQFAAEGMIEVSRREIRILDRAALASASGGQAPLS